MVEPITPQEAAKLDDEAQKQRDWLVEMLNSWIRLGVQNHQPIHFEFKTKIDVEDLEMGVVENVIRSFKAKGWNVRYSKDKSYVTEGWVWYHMFDVSK